MEYQINSVEQKINDNTITINDLENLIRTLDLQKNYSNDGEEGYYEGYYDVYRILDLIYRKIIYNPDCPKEKSLSFGDVLFRGAQKHFIIAECAFDCNDYLSALQNENFLLSMCDFIDVDDDDLSYYDPFLSPDSHANNNLETIISSLLKDDMIETLKFINPTGRILSYRSKSLNNKTIIEYIYETFKDSYFWSTISSESWLYMTDKGISLLEVITNIDRDLVSQLIKKNPNVFGDYKVATILNRLGFDIQNLNILTENDAMSLKEKYAREKFYSRYKEKQYKNEISVEASSAIEEFRNIMNSDGNSNSQLIELACAAFTEQFANNNAYAMSDLYSLINIKKQNPRFCIKKGPSPSFQYVAETLYLDSIWNIDAFNHESTHAMHYYAKKFDYPSSFMISYQFSREQLEKISKFINNVFNQKESFLKSYFDSASSSEELTQVTNYYSNYLQKISEDFHAAIEDPLYPNEWINFAIDNPISIDTFTRCFSKVIKNEIATISTGLELDNIAALEDIFDALSRGEFIKSGIEIDGQKHRNFIGGHPEGYYKIPELAFAEIIAQYVMIIKSPQSKELIGILTDIMGQEFVDMLAVFYENMYVDDKSHMRGVA